MAGFSPETESFFIQGFSQTRMGHTLTVDPALGRPMTAFRIFNSGWLFADLSVARSRDHRPTRYEKALPVCSYR